MPLIRLGEIVALRRRLDMAREAASVMDDVGADRAYLRWLIEQ